MNRAASEQREAAERKEEAARSYRREAQAELAEVEVQIATVAERLSGADEQESRTTIRSPIDGVVADLKVSTVGAVIQSGQPILEIVPVGGPLVVEAELSPTDRGFVTVVVFHRSASGDNGNGHVQRLGIAAALRCGGEACELRHALHEAITGILRAPWFGSQHGVVNDLLNKDKDLVDTFHR